MWAQVKEAAGGSEWRRGLAGSLAWRPSCSGASDKTRGLHLAGTYTRGELGGGTGLLGLVAMVEREKKKRIYVSIGGRQMR